MRSWGRWLSCRATGGAGRWIRSPNGVLFLFLKDSCQGRAGPSVPHTHPSMDGCDLTQCV